MTPSDRRPRRASAGLAPVVAASLVAATLLVASLHLPLWGMRLDAPQYPDGLHLRAYGERLEGDLYEINVLNHYVGMAEIPERPAPEMALFRPAIYALLALVLAAPFHRVVRGLALVAVAATPVVVLADLQLWLHRYGHDLDPTAPLRTPPFTPLAVGSSEVGQFTTTAWAGTGLWAIAGAFVALLVGMRLAGRRDRADGRRRAAAARAALALPVALLLAVAAAADPPAERTLQERIDAAPPGATLVVRGGVHDGPLVVRGPLTLVGRERPVVDGGGRGSVVVLRGEGVVFRGFRVRASGRQVTEEAAGIEVTGDRHTVEDNQIEDVYFGIHVAHGAGHRILGNDVAPGLARGARPGHGISLWSVRDAEVRGNRVRAARDGVYLSFVERVRVAENDVAGCRYAVHSMYSRDSAVAGNVFRRNLLGAALMYSDSLVLADNRIEEHRLGATPYAILLKDVDEVRVEGNRLVGNRVGVYAEGVGQVPGAEAVVRGNLLAGHEAALVLQHNVAVTVSGNALVDNLVDVRAAGDRLAAGTRWSADGRGNYWSRYRGHDRDGDGVGEPPHRVEGVMDGLVRGRPLLAAVLYTPAHLALEAAARMFPLFRREPLLEDPAPLLRPPPVAEAGR